MSRFLPLRLSVDVLNIINKYLFPCRLDIINNNKICNNELLFYTTNIYNILNNVIIKYHYKGQTLKYSNLKQSKKIIWYFVH
jgi:hypothetical protein